MILRILSQISLLQNMRFFLFDQQRGNTFLYSIIRTKRSTMCAIQFLESAGSYKTRQKENQRFSFI